MDDFFERQQRWLLGLIFMLGLALALMYANNQILTGDQMQMLHKGYLGAYQDIWLAFGNAASAVGNVPGSLSAWLIGGPLLLWDTPWAPMLLLIALRVVSFLLFDSVLRGIFSAPVRILFAVLYWLNPWLLYDSLLYNPSYLCFFTALHFWSAYKLKDSPSFVYSLLHVLAIGGAMQLHYSWPVLALISCFLLYRGMAKPAWSGVASAIVLLLVSLIPYIQEYSVNSELSRESDRYIGYGAVHVYPVLKALSYWLRYGSMLFSNRIITDSTFDWLTQIEWLRMVVKYSWQALLFAIGAASVVLSAWINWQSFQQIKGKLRRELPVESNTTWLLLFAAAAVFAILVNAMLSPITFSYWHLILAYPLALLPILVAGQTLLSKDRRRFVLLLTSCAIFFVFVNLIAANDSNKYSFKVNYVEQVNAYLLEKELTKQAD
ncbi:MAG: 3-deoxy-D-manno-octulosonic acid transferase [Vibrionaceae bacterium]